MTVTLQQPHVRLAIRSWDTAQVAETITRVLVELMSIKHAFLRLFDATQSYNSRIENIVVNEESIATCF
jgi:hypothetical protein